MLPLAAEGFQLVPVLQLGPELFLCHAREFVMALLETAQGSAMYSDALLRIRFISLAAPGQN